MFLDMEKFIFTMGHVKLAKFFNVGFSTCFVGMSRIVRNFVFEERCLFGREWQDNKWLSS